MPPSDSAVRSRSLVSLATLSTLTSLAALVWADRAVVAYGLLAPCSLVPTLAVAAGVLEPALCLAGLGLGLAGAMVGLTGLAGAAARAAAPAVLRITWPLFKSGVCATVFALGLKAVIGRARPFGDPSGWLAFTPFTSDPAVQSMPSAHAALAAALATTAVCRWPRGTALWIALAFLVGAMRVLGGEHWPSDVIAGLGLGTVIGLATTRKTQRHRRRAWVRRELLRAEDRG